MTPPGKQNPSPSAQEIAERVKARGIVDENHHQRWRAHVRITIEERDILTAAAVAAAEQEKKQQDFGEKEASDAITHVLQKARELITLWKTRRVKVKANKLTNNYYLDGLFDAIGDCSNDLEKVLSEHFNAAGAPPDNSNPPASSSVLPATEAFCKRFGPMTINVGYGRDIEIYKRTQEKLFLAWCAGEAALSWTSVDVALPDVAPKHRTRFLVTARSVRNGQHYVDVAAFVKDYWLEWSDEYYPDDEKDADDNGGKIWNGWMQDMLSSCGDEVSCDYDGEVIAWMPFPTPSVGRGDNQGAAPLSSEASSLAAATPAQKGGK